MLIYKCDRCGKSFEHKSKDAEYSANKNTDIGWPLSVDLCSECQKKFDAFMNNKRLTISF